MASQPDPLIITINSVRTIAGGSPLHRLQAVFEDPEVELFAGDVRDVVNAATIIDPKCEPAKALLSQISGKLKGDKVTVDPASVAAITDWLKTNADAPQRTSVPPGGRRKPAFA